MRTVLGWIRARLVPAVVTAGGVALLAAGLLSYQDPPEAVAVAPSPTAAPTVRPAQSLLPIPSLGPAGSPAPSTGPDAGRIATRVVIPVLRIDLAVVRPPDDPEHFPYCNVAEYLPQLSQPGYPGTTYLYAHARKGMFLPLLETEDRKLRGMLVQVYTDDDQVYLYEITDVLRHRNSLDIAFEATEEQLMLQTSEGPREGVPGHTGLLTIVIARPISVGRADPTAAHPIQEPIACE